MPEPRPRLLPYRDDALAIGGLLVLVFVFFRRAALLRGYFYLGDIVFFFEPAKALLHESLPRDACPSGRSGSSPATRWRRRTDRRFLPRIPPRFLAASRAGRHQLADRSARAARRGRRLSTGATARRQTIRRLARRPGLRLQRLSVRAYPPRQPVLRRELAAADHPLRGARGARGLGAECRRRRPLLGRRGACGHPQTLFANSLVVLFWVLWRWWESRRGGNRRAHGRGSASWPSRSGWASRWPRCKSCRPRRWPRRLPTADGVTLPTSPPLVSPCGVSPASVWPHPVHVLYIGLAPLGLAVLGGVRRRGWPLALLGIGALALALGRRLPSMTCSASCPASPTSVLLPTIWWSSRSRPRSW